MATTLNPSKDKLVGDLKSLISDAEELLKLTADPAVKDLLKVATQEAVARGVFGAPTFFVGGEMFWGQDRLDFVKEALQ